MPKPLTRPQPTSSVANMLESGVAMRVMAKPAPARQLIVPIPAPTPPSTENPVQDAMRPFNSHSVEPSGEVPGIPRQFNLTASADRTLKRLISVYSQATGLELKHSELLRAILFSVEHSLPELIREAQTIGPLSRPKNDRGREAEREELEHCIARAFAAGMREAAMRR